MKIALVLLASGNSLRFGGNKLLYPIQGKPMYRHLVDQAAGCAALFIRRILVTQYEEIANDPAVSEYEIVQNNHSALGISHSIHLALDVIEEIRLAEAACFAVCDQPYLKRATLEAFVTQWQHSGKGLGCCGFGGTLGNPVIFSRRYFPELLDLRGDKGGKRIIRRHLDDLMVFETDAHELEDIDIQNYKNFP